MLPLFFHHDKEESIDILRTLYQAGIRVFEFTNRGPEALSVFESLLAVRDLEMPDLYLGIGTIKSVEDATQFLQIGADFIVAPLVNPAVGALVHEQDKLWIPGCMTPTEIYTAQQQKAALIKLFPANILGPAFMSSIRDLLKVKNLCLQGCRDRNGKFKNMVQVRSMCCWYGQQADRSKNTDRLAENTKLALEFVSKAR
ncbi:bifunctional 4-hydroxy-2-oxoglutarate aldolase/2-dehydro-3-deoxy-phosphogluconate aldolase [Sphingobacterium sp. E70]|uniref:bifunctional 4-hydroxy-2-oxoglutarate aldolase/2-dehydro-3-deoxy-phosphogluconate aldolase n=1 Tax=Sphingobacterium sp. E70 TaxID=2853439 RepID=UPI00211BBCD5|nr:bifunctional 4-hydroxy-2-oxoglutarate aldolase/2-dehydro-3-deoxy-phosphogluconate aldolase [Sphingobacterium sp. E70]ULT28662.1 bifunctional 4-hydroxy-2-oxoglutarate aldolase/2-dehydro-3-deoxy-phosphogluconate aldolase [Sphingobacterium sp. E70]